MNYELFHVFPHQAVGVDAFADERFTQEFVVRLHMVVFPQLLQCLSATAFLLAALEGKGVHDHVCGFGTDDVAYSGHAWSHVLGLRTDEDGQAFVFRHHHLLHLRPFEGGVVGSSVTLFLCSGDEHTKNQG